MQQAFSSSDYSPKSQFGLWKEFLGDHLLPVEVRRLGDAPFEAKCEVAALGPLQISRVTQSALRLETTPAAIRDKDKSDAPAVMFKGFGESVTVQDGRESVHRPGDLVVLDWAPQTMTTLTPGQSLFVRVPRDRLESALGSTRHYTSLTVGAALASTKLATSFVQDLVKVRRQLASESAARMASIAVDLIVASVAERMAQDVPRLLHGTVAVQQAKAYIEAHIGDRRLDPAQIAAAAGLSLRRLQELFAERDRNISDYIWQRRLETAAKRLVDPGCTHLSIAAIAQSCGFADAAHFSRRFKALHDMTPSEYRVTQMVQARERLFLD